MTNRIPRAEHPDPQFERAAWRNLNGTWEFEIDKSNSGEARGLITKEHLAQTITVPFCPESSLSGVGETDFMNAVWYKRSINISAEELYGDVLLHFGAVDYKCKVYVNGKLAGEHMGGYSSFAIDITPYVQAGENLLTVHAVDNIHDPLQPMGKQSDKYFSYACSYTRTTGIWQTVWLEFVPKARINFFHILPNAENGSVVFEVYTNTAGTVKAECSYKGKSMGSCTAQVGTAGGSFEIALAETHLWEVGCGRLYDVTLTFGEDVVSTYFGLRSIGFDGTKFMLNGKSVFQRLVLDQGFYPDGIYTAPTEEALLNDVKLSQAMGFNGARLHEKIFEPRFLYHCDREGYLVWGEYPNWGLDESCPEALHAMLGEWLETLRRDRNHPSIVGWCPFNETFVHEGRKQYDPTISSIYYITKSVDPTRPCIDTSGYIHVATDIYCVHDYDQNPATFKARYDKLMTDGILNDPFVERAHPPFRLPLAYQGGPAFVSEYGGTAWMKGDNAWGYGDMPKTEEEFLTRIKGLTDALLDNDQMFGYCYTQLYDIEQEMNGLYTYDRKPKFPPEVIAKIFSRPAAIEKE